MTNRSRLDEIVDAAFPFKEPSSLTLQLAKNRATVAVQDAFRHGVDRDRESLAVAFGTGRDTLADVVDAIPRKATVQPAPAGEKPNPCPDCLDPREWHRVGCPVKDRRKGERRKGKEKRANVGSRDDYGTIRANDVQPMFLRAEDFYAWYYDRRSGKDRRK